VLMWFALPLPVTYSFYMHPSHVAEYTPSRAVKIIGARCGFQIVPRQAPGGHHAAAP